MDRLVHNTHQIRSILQKILYEGDHYRWFGSRLYLSGAVPRTPALLEIPAAAGFGLGRVRIVAPFEDENSLQGRFFINEVVTYTTAIDQIAPAGE